MTTFTVNIIGSGRVGSTLARSLKDAHGFELSALISRDQFAAGSFLSSDIFFIATPDDVIKEVAVSLQSSGKVDATATVIHCSGALPGAILKECGLKNAASFHPVKSLNRNEGTLEGCTVCIEGDEAAIALAQSCATAMRALPIRIESALKPLYHASTVFSSNFLVGLLSITVDQLKRVGMPSDQATALAFDLAESALTNVRNQGLRDGLTGPVARGDERTIDAHRAALSDSGDLQQLYNLLTKQLQALVQ